MPTDFRPSPRRRRILSTLVVVLALIATALISTLVHRTVDAVRGTPVRVIGARMPGEALRTSEPDFAERAAALAAVDLEAGHQVEILVDAAALERIVADLEGARRSITFAGYYCDPGQLGDRVTAVLMARARAGVEVLFLGDDFGCGPLLDEVGEALRAAGVEVARFRPLRWYTLHRAQHRLHSRVVVIDGVVGYTGGFGIADKWVRDLPADPLWRDTSVRFTGPAVHVMQAAFLASWTEATGDLHTGDALFAEPQPVAPAGEPALASGQPALPSGDPAHPPADPASSGLLAGFLTSRPVIGTTVAERYVAVTLAAAERTIYLTNSYFVPTDLIQELLLDAVRRGVDVRLLLPGDLIDVGTTRYAGRTYYEDFLRAGIRIYEYQPAMIHAKSFAVDGVWSAVGTLNLDTRSARLNEESALVVHDRAFGARMDSLFMDDLSRAQEITLETHGDRPLKERILERLARLIAPLL